MKTKEVILDSSFFEFDTFKVEKSNEGNFNIYTGRVEDKHHIFTPQLSFFNFDNYKEAQEMCRGLDEKVNFINALVKPYKKEIPKPRKNNKSGNVIKASQQFT